MASEQFSLCWDNFHKNMSAGMNSLLEHEDLVDVTLAVEGRYLKAHKMVLSVCSPYFKELFKTNPCKHPIVFMKDVSYVAMGDLLQFMYQGEVQVSQENLTTFIKTAEALQIKGLTGDGNGSAEGDNEDEPKTSNDVEPPKVAPTTRAKKIHQSSAPPAKRPRVSAPEPAVTTPAVTKTEPAPVSTSAPTNELIQFKMEPYDQGQSAVTIPGDNPDESFTDDPLDESNADDGNEDYSMMEGGDEEPQAGTSADGTAGEGQAHLKVGTSFAPWSTPSTFAVLDNLVKETHFDRSSVFQERMVTLLQDLKEQNRQIINVLGNPLQNDNFEDFFPVKLPISNDDELNLVESFIHQQENFHKFTTYLSSLGGKDLIMKTNRILRTMLTNKFASNYSFFGKRGGKRAFNDLSVKRAIVCAIKKTTPEPNEKAIEDSIKVWLKHSPQRSKMEDSKQTIQNIKM